MLALFSKSSIFYKLAFEPNPRVFNFSFLFIMLFLFIASLISASILYKLHRLPSLPLTGTNCIDEKFAFLHDADVSNVDMIAVGSSVTWRNVRMSEFISSGLAEKPINAAPCFLHMNQTAFLTEFLLDRMPTVDTVVTVVAPRDFSDCRDIDTKFFNTDHAGTYIFDKGFPWYLYFTNFRPRPFFLDLIRLPEMRLDPRSDKSVRMETFGAGPILVEHTFYPEPRFDDQCFQWLTKLEEIVTSRHARLIVVTFPTADKWRQMYDPDGTIISKFKKDVQASLRRSDTQIISGDDFPAEQTYFADGVHFLWPYTNKFTQFIAQHSG